VRGPGTASGNRPPGPSRGLRRLTTRVAASRSRHPATTPSVAEAVPTPVGHLRPAARPDPRLRWKDPSEAPAGDFTATALPNVQLRVHGIPDRGDSRDTVSSFALTYDGYAYWDDVTELATRSIRAWTRHRLLPDTIDEIRGCLFYEQRRWHHFGEEPTGRGALYLWALLDSLRHLVVARTTELTGRTDRAERADREPGRFPAKVPAKGPAPEPSVSVRPGPRIRGPIRSFLDDDAGYLAWTTGHADGFVVNAGRTLSPHSLVLHRASCPSIGGLPSAGRTRTANYRKVCAADLEVLLDWSRTDIGVDPGCCRRCLPHSLPRSAF